MALLIRFCSIWRRRKESNNKTSAMRGSFEVCSLRLCLWATVENAEPMSSIKALRLQGSILSVSLPASIFDRSKTWFRIPRRDSAEECALLSKVFSFVGRGLLSNNSCTPKMAFMGVRISWLMVARKADFAAFAFSACSFDEMSS